MITPGTAMMTENTQTEIVSKILPKYPAMSPATVPIVNATSDRTSAACMAPRVDAISRLRMSRPYASPPRGYSPVNGGRFVSFRSTRA